MISNYNELLRRVQLLGVKKKDFPTEKECINPTIGKNQAKHKRETVKPRVSYFNQDIEDMGEGRIVKELFDDAKSIDVTTKSNCIGIYGSLDRCVGISEDKPTDRLCVVWSIRYRKFHTYPVTCK
jgi:hypothetical protein